jgi:hypothetical protein
MNTTSTIVMMACLLYYGEYLLHRDLQDILKELRKLSYRPSPEEPL